MIGYNQFRRYVHHDFFKFIKAGCLDMQAFDIALRIEDLCIGIPHGFHSIIPPHPTLSRLGRGQKIPGYTRIEDVYSLIRSVRRRFRAAAISKARGRAKLPGCRSPW